MVSLRMTALSIRPAGLLGLAAAAVALAASPAAADISPVVLHVRASNANGVAEFSAMLEAGEFNPDGSYSWTLQGGPRELRTPGGELIGTLMQGNTFIIADPVVSIGFAVQASGLDTTFQITSALLSFSPINPAEGRASGGITGTDATGNGVTITGHQAGGRIITTQYNGFVPAGTTFANLIAGPLSNPNPVSTVTANDASPAIGFDPIAGTVTNMSLQYFFTLSAGDLASGTAVFVVLPSPGAAAVLAMAGVLAVRRRR